MFNVDYSSHQSNKDLPQPSSLAYSEQPTYSKTDTVPENDYSSECPIQPMGYDQSQNPELIHSDVHELDLVETPRNDPPHCDTVSSMTAIIFHLRQ